MDLHTWVNLHLGLHPMAPRHSGTYLGLDWPRFAVLAGGLAHER